MRRNLLREFLVKIFAADNKNWQGVGEKSVHNEGEFFYSWIITTENNRMPRYPGIFSVWSEINKLFFVFEKFDFTFVVPPCPTRTTALASKPSSIRHQSSISRLVYLRFLFVEFSLVFCLFQSESSIWWSHALYSNSFPALLSQPMIIEYSLTVHTESIVHLPDSVLENLNVERMISLPILNVGGKQ